MAVQGTEQLLKDFERILKDNMQRIQNVTVAASATVTAEMKSSIMGRSKTGKKWSSLPNRSSAAGEAPANQSGDLSRAIRAILSPDKLEAKVGVPNSANLNYAKWLEYGTRGMAPRSFVFPALQKHKKKITEDYKKALGVKL
mgnify:CR=1 FL=1